MTQLSDPLLPPRRALQLLKQGGFLLGPEWDEAHAICQQAEGTFAYDLVHALAHWIEGDSGNRDYWYRRVGSGWTRSASIAAEHDAIAAAFAKDAGGNA